MNYDEILETLKRVETKQVAQLDQIITPLADMEEELDLIKDQGLEAITYLGEPRFEKLIKVAAMFAGLSVHRRRLEFQIADLRTLVKGESA